VLQAARNLGFEQEPLAAGRIVRVPVKDLLESDLTVQFLIDGDEYRTQTALGMRSNHAKTLALAGGRADCISGCAVRVAVVVGRGDA